MLVIIPEAVIIGNKIIKALLLHSLVRIGHIIPAEHPVIPLPCDAVIAHGKRAGKNMPAVIICMLADEINPAGSKIASDVSIRSKHVLKTFKSLIDHNTSPFG